LDIKSAVKKKRLIYLGGLITLLFGCGPMAIPPTIPATGTNAHSIDEVAEWVKGSYLDRSPETPPYITNQASIVPAAQLFPLFSSQGVPIDVRKTDYHYCNLPNAHWLLLRGQKPPKFPVLWSPTPDAVGQRLVVTPLSSSPSFFCCPAPCRLSRPLEAEEGSRCGRPGVAAVAIRLP
jgi:hypothetical protein